MSFSKKPAVKRRNRVAMASQVPKNDKLKPAEASISDVTKTSPYKNRSPRKKNIMKKGISTVVPVLSESNVPTEDVDRTSSPGEVTEANFLKEIEEGLLQENMTAEENDHNMTYNMLVKSLFSVQGEELLQPPGEMSMQKLDETIENIMTDMQEIDSMYQETAKRCCRLLRMWEVKQDMLTLLSANKAEREYCEKLKVIPGRMV